MLFMVETSNLEKLLSCFINLNIKLIKKNLICPLTLVHKYLKYKSNESFLGRVTIKCESFLHHYNFVSNPFLQLNHLFLTCNVFGSNFARFCFQKKKMNNNVKNREITNIACF